MTPTLFRDLEMPETVSSVQSSWAADILNRCHRVAENDLCGEFYLGGESAFAADALVK